MPPKSPQKRYKVLVGLNYPDPRPGRPERRAEPGDVISDVPPLSLGWLLEQKVIEEVD